MKRFVLTGFAVIFALIFAGCEITYYPVTIENKSSKQVGYFYNGSTDTLRPGASKDYQVKAYTQKPSNITFGEALTVKMIHEGEKYIFEDIASFALDVTNNLSVPVRIRADNYIDADGAGKTELEVPGSGHVDTARIYTSKPKFTISADYPTSLIKVEWKMENNTISVTINKINM